MWLCCRRARAGLAANMCVNTDSAETSARVRRSNMMPDPRFWRIARAAGLCLVLGNVALLPG
jgi:hypothetical protein